MQRSRDPHVVDHGGVETRRYVPDCAEPAPAALSICGPNESRCRREDEQSQGYRGALGCTATAHHNSHASRRRPARAGGFARSFDTPQASDRARLALPPTKPGRGIRLKSVNPRLGCAGDDESCDAREWPSAFDLTPEARDRRIALQRIRAISRRTLACGEIPSSSTATQRNNTPAPFIVSICSFSRTPLFQ